MPRNSLNQAEKRLQEVTEFLLGEGQLEGCWFGDPPPTKVAGRPATYWWRKHLRAAVKAVVKSRKE